jgi:hypothetical protein
MAGESADSLKAYIRCTICLNAAAVVRLLPRKRRDNGGHCRCNSHIFLALVEQIAYTRGPMYGGGTIAFFIIGKWAFDMADYKGLGLSSYGKHLK